jgi:acetyl esterase/lipase
MFIFTLLKTKFAIIATIVAIGIIYPQNSKAQEVINIWKGTKNKSVKVTVKAYPAINSQSRAAVIICPGGSYFWLGYKIEGDDVAQWLQANEISAFVLRYRTAGEIALLVRYRTLNNGNMYPLMLQDMQRSIQVIRENAEKYNIDRDRIGVMGFSAGGHLAMMSDIFYKSNFIASYGIESSVSLKPNFIASIYPVVTFSDARYAHKRSQRGLLGDSRYYDKVMQDSLSIEKHITPDTSPVFLVNCKDDPTVKYQNSVLLDSALTANSVQHKYILYEKGGHGFGVTASKTSPEAIHWKEEFLKWIKTLF